jgi:hypothetical protein
MYRMALLGLLIAIGWYPSGAFAQQCAPTQKEQNIWDGIKQSAVPQEFLAYLKEFPKGCFRDLAIFKIEALVPEIVALTASLQVAQDERWFSGGNGQLVSGGENVVESMKISADHIAKTVLAFDYQCDGAGKGVTSASNGQPCPSNGRAPIQGFSVSIAGSLAEFYDLSTNCTTLHKPDNSKKPYSVKNGEWCGVHGGTPATYICNMTVKVTRKKFE